MACGSALDTNRMAWGGAAKRCGVVCGRGGFSDRDSVCDTRLAHLHRLLPESRGAHAYDVVWIGGSDRRSEEHTSELQSPCNLVCRLLLEKKKQLIATNSPDYYIEFTV